MKIPETGKIFRIKGSDLTFLKMENDKKSTFGARAMLYLRFEKLWMYPPTNKQIDVIWKSLENNGFVYAEQEFNTEVERLESERI